MSKNKSINKKKESKGKQSMDETWMKVLGYEMGRQTKQPAPVSWQIGDIGADRIDNLLRQIPHLR